MIKTTSLISPQREWLNSVLQGKLTKKMVAIILILAILLLLWQLGVDRNLVTSKAVQVTHIRDWSINYVPYQWLSDHTVLYPVKGQDTGEPSNKLNIWAYDLLTHRVRQQDGLTSNLGRMEATKFEINYQTGEILWSNPDEFVVTTNTGVFEGHFKSLLSGWYFWLGNKRTIGHFIRYTDGMEIVDISGKRLVVTRKLGFPKLRIGSTPLVEVIKSPLSGRIMLASWLPNPQLYSHEGIFETSIIYDDEIRSTASALRLGDKPEASIEEYSVEDKCVSIRRATIILPHHASIQDMVISPDGRRVLWQLRFSQSSSLTRLGRWIPAFRNRQNTYIAFWLSNIDGSGLHEIAYQPEENPLPASVKVFRLGDGSSFIPRQEDQQKCQPSNVRWLPGSDNISFLYKDCLWLLPVR